MSYSSESNHCSISDWAVRALFRFCYLILICGQLLGSWGLVGCSIIPKGGLFSLCLICSFGAGMNSSILLCLPGQPCCTASEGLYLEPLLGSCLIGGAARSQRSLLVCVWGKYSHLSLGDLSSFPDSAA